MGFLSLTLTFVGYLLVYASVANHGRFAVAPWTGVLADAYTDASPAGSGAPSQGQAPGAATPAPGKPKGSPSVTIPLVPLPPGVPNPFPKIRIPWPF